jgi:putative ABC transport system permease protein
MNLMTVAFKNLSRKRIRTALTLFGIAIAVAVLVSLLGFDAGYQRALNADIERMGYQVLVTAKGCPYEAATLMLKGGGGLRHMDDEVYRRIVGDPRIDKVTQQLVTTAYDAEGGIDNRGAIAMYMGIVDSYLALKPWISFRSGGWFSNPEADEAILGYEAAELEQRSVGDKIFIPGRDAVLTVTGILERTGTQDDGLIFLPLASARRIFDLPGKITGIGIKLKNLTQIGAFEEDLYEEPGIQVVSMAQVKGTILNLMSSARTLTSAIAVVAVFIAVIGVLNTILMSVFERTKEIGVLKALGASRAEVFRLIWFETLLLCGIGSVLGNVLALLGGRVLQTAITRILPYAPSGDLVVVSATLVAGSIVGSLLVGLAAGMYPAARAAAMRPVEAIRVAD